jgi:NAD(P)-dependent dehydrogenase (short-subunit alcohol dehydrogenase family)
MSTFGFSSTTDDVLSGVDLSGTQVVVTGASTGLGEETARALAAHGATVTMAVRDLDRGTAAADRIRASVPDAQLEVMQVDLASLASVRSFADAYLEAHEGTDVLINNAGLMACPQGTTVDGFELQFGTNHLGHFLLGVLLAPSLVNRAVVSGGPSRLVSLSSRGHAFADVDLDDWNFERTPYDPFVAYGRAKTANALFALGFQQRYGHLGVLALSVHPGGIHTELGRHMTRETIDSLMQRITASGREMTWKTIPQGAATSVWAATSPDLVGHGGAYLEDCSVAEVSDDEAANAGVRAYAIDPVRADALWTLSERLVGLA